MAKKLQLGYHDIENRLQIFKNEHIEAGEVGYMLLGAYGKSEHDIERYKEGKGIVKTFTDGLLIRGLFCYRPSDTVSLTATLEALKTDVKVLKACPKIVATSDGKDILAYDLREEDTYENPLSRLCYDFNFFNPLMGVERVHNSEESAADIKAAEKLAKLHDELRAYNEFNNDEELHDLNIFITRLLFCFFAEDTGIFEENLFTHSIAENTREDGSDLSEYLNEAFNIMDCRERSADTLKIISCFPYVNGGLFAKRIRIPKMGAKARRIILQCGELNWGEINPDIFGSMIQAVVNPKERANQGIHYTSVPNIMKVIKPLFLDDLEAQYSDIATEYQHLCQMHDLGAFGVTEFYNKSKSVLSRCVELLSRISKMKFFDPACGSGNFLVITYKNLRLLEMRLLHIKQACQPQGMELKLLDVSCIRLDQFYGIELFDFPHEVAMLSLWLAEHQMNRKFNREFRVNTNALPLHNIRNIVCGNACRTDWNEVCPHTAEDEVYIFGNPPYLGSKVQTAEQKEDIKVVFGDLKNSKILDYISIWFYLGSRYIADSKAKLAFVSTNSICQGEQVAVLWPLILSLDVEIGYAYQSFKWSNNAKHNAGVTVVIIGLRCSCNADKYIYSDDRKQIVENINPYLHTGSKTIVAKEIQPPVNLPKMCFGSMPYDNGNLLFNKSEYELFIEKYPEDAHFLRRIYGSEEFINGIFRYCLWIEDDELEQALQNPEIRHRVEKNKLFRLGCKDIAGRKLAEKPHQFREHPNLNLDKMIVPSVSSERRKYIPMGYLTQNANVAISNLAFAIYDAPMWLFGILTSAIHMIWVKTVGGRLKTDYRYSAQLCYNTFPFPKISTAKKEEIAAAAEEVLGIREGYAGESLAVLYDPDTMPDELREAHACLDNLVESCYPGYPFANDEARLECLFKLYEKMTAKK